MPAEGTGSGDVVFIHGITLLCHMV
jgi:hypothetical protein